MGPGHLDTGFGYAVEMSMKVDNGISALKTASSRALTFSMIR